jgi:hypothetical protein
MSYSIPMTRRDFIRAHAILGGASVGRFGWRLAEAQPRAPIIDMHLHALPADFLGKPDCPIPSQVPRLPPAPMRRSCRPASPP